MSFSDFPLPPCSSRALSSASPPPRPTRATCLSYHVPLYPTDCNRRRTLGRLPSHSQIQPCVPFREIIDRSRKFEIYYRLIFLSCEYYLNYFLMERAYLKISVGEIFKTRRKVCCVKKEEEGGGERKASNRVVWLFLLIYGIFFFFFLRNEKIKSTSPFFFPLSLS